MVKKNCMIPCTNKLKKQNKTDNLIFSVASKYNIYLWVGSDFKGIGGIWLMGVLFPLNWMLFTGVCSLSANVYNCTFLIFEHMCIYILNVFQSIINTKWKHKKFNNIFKIQKSYYYLRKIIYIYLIIKLLHLLHF